MLKKRIPIMMFDQAEETLTYEPTSFVAQRANVNPDSPRHFKNKKRRNNANLKLKHRPRSLIDFRFESRTKAHRADGFGFKRSKTVVERCRGALRRAMSMDFLLDDDDKTSETDKNSLSKPITSRLNVREIRKLNTERPVIGYPLSRSKSETSVFISNGFEDDCKDIPFEDTLTDTRNSCTYTAVCDDLKERVTNNKFTYFNRDNCNSLDSVITRSEGSTTSSPNSSGFCDCTSSEHDALSRDDSISSDGSLGAAHCNNNRFEGTFENNNRFEGTFESSPMDILFDKDKNAEERSYARSWEKNRRPQSIVRNISISRIRNNNRSQQINSSSCPPTISLVYTPPSINDVDNVFVTNNGEQDNDVDSGVESKASPTYRRTNKYNSTKQRNKQILDCRLKHKITEEDLVREVNVPLRPVHKTVTHKPHTSTARTCDNNNEIKTIDRRISIEEYVEKLSVSLRNLSTQSPRGTSRTPRGSSQTPPNNSSNRRARRKVTKSKSMDYSVKSKRQTGKSLSIDNGRPLLSFYRNIRIESVL